MDVKVDIRQTCTVVEGNLYRVKLEVLYASNISNKIFTYDLEGFSRVATVWDIENIEATSLSEAESLGLTFYRQASVTKDFDQSSKAIEFATYSRNRIAWLVEEYKAATSGFEGVTEYTYTD
jgi:hypothetical protein